MGRRGSAGTEAGPEWPSGVASVVSPDIKPGAHTTMELQMPTSVKDMLAAANECVPKIAADEARRLVDDEDALLVDCRDLPEVEQSGKLKQAVHVSRGMLEFRADDATPYHNPEFRRDRPVVLYCASGGRAALSGKALHDMGYERVYNLGGFKDAAEAGFPIENG